MTSRIQLNDKTSIPWLAFGTGTALYGRDALDAVRLAIDKGITHLDGAQIYNNEGTLGAGIRASGKPRSELYLVTKLKQPLAPSQTVKESLQRSLERLGVEYVDLFLIHSPSPANSEGTLKELWRGMEEVKRLGLTKSIGVSNFRVEDIQEVLESATILPAVNQVMTMCKLYVIMELTTSDRTPSLYMESCGTHRETWSPIWYYSRLLRWADTNRSSDQWSIGLYPSQHTRALG